MTAYVSKKSVVSVPSFKATTAITGFPGRLGFSASSNACVALERRRIGLQRRHSDVITAAG